MRKGREESMSKRKRIVRGILIGVAAVVGAGAIAVLAFVIVHWRQPLGPSLGWETDTPTMSPTTPLPGETDTPTGVPPTPTEEPPTSTPTPEPLCGGPPVMLVLGIGADSRSNTYLYGLADVVWIARIDFVEPSVSVIKLPRELAVDIPGLEARGITEGLLNQAYLWGQPGMGYYDGPGEGPGLLARTLELNFGLRVDQYLAVNMVTFERIIDAVGGIYVYVPYTVDARGRPTLPATPVWGYFAAGSNWFNGKAALRYARLRKFDSDTMRTYRQSQVICALQERLLSTEVIDKIPALIDAFKGSVRTDLSLEQISQLSCLALQMPRRNVTFSVLPSSLYTKGYLTEESMVLNAYFPDSEAVADLLQRFVAGEWPERKPAVVGTPAPGEPTLSGEPTEEFIIERGDIFSCP
jgi:LCP family protein required for cell wall assembly